VELTAQQLVLDELHSQPIDARCSWARQLRSGSPGFHRYLYVRHHLRVAVYWLHIDVRSAVGTEDSECRKVHHGVVAV
jgi:hypothetical protein